MNDKVNDVSEVLSHLELVLNKTEGILDEWKGQGCLQFSTLFSMIATELGWNDLQIKEHDPIIRYFIAQHSRYSSRRGARGGIIRSADKARIEKERQEKVNRKLKEEEAREELINLINSRAMKVTKEDLGEE